MENLVQIGFGMIIIPWACWCTVSIFNQRQELALMKQSHMDLKLTLDKILEVFTTVASTKKKA